MLDPLTIARNATAPAVLLPQMANRHGCITGATGTGKTITLQVLAVGEALVSLLDAKGQPTPTQRVWTMAPGSHTSRRR
ncbi:MAG: DUF853 family protein [Castellaniella sp.]|uniref:helicase HerA-like domain-containing protein n=1 Tax=Castellaniella sp. TaxID=1955812 RepID=UPI0011F7C4D2|nr:helicase HerA-like domain-containing protein [Castellaniella sp.]TAN26056.1 MAG: DUF853 family protein [Castellaniella sp.]